MTLRAVTLALGLLLAWSQAKARTPPDCITHAARFHGVKEMVLRAIAFHESRMKTWEVRRNTNGTYDIGVMQINTIHLAELARLGIGPVHLKDGCVSAFGGLGCTGARSSATATPGWLSVPTIPKHLTSGALAACCACYSLQAYDQPPKASVVSKGGALDLRSSPRFDLGFERAGQ